MKKLLPFVLCGAVFGFVGGMAVSFLISKPAMDRAISVATQYHTERDALAQQVQRLQQQLSESLQNADQAIQQANTLRASFSEGTVLYEAPAISTNCSGPGAGGLLAVLAGGTAQASRPAMQPRWFIPARVKPIVYGDPSSVQIFYLDAQGRRSGPIAPEILPVQ